MIHQQPDSQPSFDLPFETKLYRQLQNGIPGEDPEGIPCFMSNVTTLCNTFALTPTELSQAIQSINQNVLEIINDREINQAEHIEYNDARKEIYYYGVENTPIRLSLREAQTLTFALDSLTISDETKTQLQNALLFDAQPSAEKHLNTTTINKDILISQSSPEVLSSLIEAIQFGKRLSILYISRTNQGLPKQHIIDPLFIKGYYHKLFLRAWDVESKQFLTFSLTGITRIIDTEDSVEVVSDDSNLMDELNDTQDALIATLIIPKESLNHFIMLPSCLSWSNDNGKKVYAKRVHLTNSTLSNPYRIRLAIQQSKANKLWFYSYLAHYELEGNLIFEGCQELKTGYAKWSSDMKEQALSLREKFNR